MAIVHGYYLSRESGARFITGINWFEPLSIYNKIGIGVFTYPYFAFIGGLVYLSDKLGGITGNDGVVLGIFSIGKANNFILDIQCEYVITASPSYTNKYKWPLINEPLIQLPQKKGHYLLPNVYP